MATSTTTKNDSLVRKLIASVVFVFTNIMAWNLPNGHHVNIEIPKNASHIFQLKHADHELISGVGLVTTDGAWGDPPEDVRKKYDIKILGFTDKNYLAISRFWYKRMSHLVGTYYFISLLFSLVVLKYLEIIMFPSDSN